AAHLWAAWSGLGGERRAVATLPAGRRPARGAGDSARALRAQRGVLGLRDGTLTRLALDTLRAVLRRRRHFFRLRDGDHPRRAHAVLLPSARVYRAASPRRAREAAARDRTGPHLFLRVRRLHGLVQRHRGFSTMTRSTIRSPAWMRVRTT